VNIRIKHSEIKLVLFFILDYGFCFFLPVRSHSHHLLFLISYFLFIYIYGSGIFRQIFFPVGFHSAVRHTTQLQSFTHSRLEDQPKVTKCVVLRGLIKAVVVGYLLYRYIFMHVYISCSTPTLTKTKY